MPRTLPQAGGTVEAVRGLVVALLVACSLSAARAEADDNIHSVVVVVGHEPELIQALEWVMEGQNMGVKALGDRPTPSLAELGPESRRIADDNQASATVWISPTAAGATLVTYERTADRFVVREVPYKLPLDETQAAETARMVSVMLRAVRDRNDEEAVAARVRAQRPPRPQRAEPQVAASVGGGAWFAAPEATAVAMTTIAVAWRPHGLGAAVTAMIAPATDIESTMFIGEVGVWRIAAEARKALRVAPLVRVTPGVGLALHKVSLDGRTGGEVVSSRRYNPALQISTVVGIALPHHIELGLAVAADCLLRRQRYEAGTQQILDVPRIQAMMAILIGVRL